MPPAGTLDLAAGPAALYAGCPQPQAGASPLAPARQRANNHPMPLYEYTCEDTGETIELIRPMADADKPLTRAEIESSLGADAPTRKARRFVRKLSTFQAKSDAAQRPPLPTPGAGPGCGCGNPMGPCNIN